MPSDKRVVATPAGLPALDCVEPIEPAAAWTVLVYIASDNNLEEEAARDLHEMFQADLPASVKVLVLWDRRGRTVFLKNKTKVAPWSEALLIRVTKDAPVAKTAAIVNLGEINTGDPAELARFIDWGKRCYPSRYSALVVSNHGQGWRAMTRVAADAALFWKFRVTTQEQLKRAASFGLDKGRIELDELIEEVGPRPESSNYKGIGGDEDTDGDNQPDNDWLYNREIADVLKTRRVDLLGFDACLMSMIETAYAMRAGAGYMVASTDLEPGEGWEYTDMLTRLAKRPTMSPRELAAAMVASYEQSVVQADTTLAATDLAAVERTARDVSTLANALIDAMKTKPALKAQLQEIRRKLPVYAKHEINKRTKLPSFQHVDLRMFAARLDVAAMPDPVRIAARRVHANLALGQLVLANHGREDREWSSGLAIYFPQDRRTYDNDDWESGAYRRGNTSYPVAFVEEATWSLFLHDYF